MSFINICVTPDDDLAVRYRPHHDRVCIDLGDNALQLPTERALQLAAEIQRAVTMSRLAVAS